MLIFLTMAHLPWRDNSPEPHTLGRGILCSACRDPHDKTLYKREVIVDSFWKHLKAESLVVAMESSNRLMTIFSLGHITYSIRILTGLKLAHTRHYAAVSAYKEA